MARASSTASSPPPTKVTKAATKATSARTVVAPTVASQGGARGTVVGRLHERRREISLTLVLAASVFSVLALSGHAVDDPTWLSPDPTRTRETANWTGPLGALWADGLLRFVGWGAWLVSVLTGAGAVLALARRPLGRFAHWVVGTWLVVMLLATAHLLAGEGLTGAALPGGWVGEVLSNALVDAVGVAGAGVVLLATLTTAGSVLAGVSWGQIANRFVGKVEAGLPVVQQRAVVAGGHAAVATKVGVVGVSRGALGVFSIIGNGLFALARWMASVVVRVAVGARDAFKRPHLDDLDDDAWSRITGITRPEADPDAVGDPTAVLEDGLATDPGVEVRGARASWTPTDPDATDSPHALFGALVPRDPTEVVTSPTPVRVTQARGGPAVPTPAAARAVPVVVAPVAPKPPPRPVRPDVLDAPPMSALRVYAPDDEEDDEDLDDDLASQAGYDEGDDEDDDTDAAVPSEGRERQPLQVEPVEGLQLKPAVDDGRSVSDHGTLYFELPPLSLLDPVPEQRATIDEAELMALARTVEEALASFKVTGQVTNVRVGPVVTIFEFLPDPGIKVRRVASLADDLAMALLAPSVRVVAPIPGKGVVGIEVPSKNRLAIYLRELLASPEFRKSEADLPVALGKDTEGRPIVEDLAKMPHLLVGGTTGAGKSVGVNGMLLSLLFTRTPEELRLLLVDPKKLEFEAYNGVPHLLHPVVTDATGAAAALAWACREMDRRYELLSRWQTRSIGSFNKKVEREMKQWTREKAYRYAGPDWPEGVAPPKPEMLPFIVVVIDELADLMMTAKKEVQDSIVRLAQMARACGIHLIVATQRPSVDVVTGLIKSNLPTRISFKLRSVIDSRTILDQGGAEKLLGRGDMLVLTGGADAKRVHGAFVSDDEVVRVIDFLRAQRDPDYIEDITRAAPGSGDGDAGYEDPEMDDDLYDQALNFVLDKGKASTSMVQRQFKIGYNRAARLIDAMEAAGVVGPADGARPREVLIGHSG